MQAAPVESAQHPPQTAGTAPVIIRLAGRFALENARGQHGTQRQRHDGGQEHRDGEYEAEFAEQPAGLPRQEGERYKHGN